MKQFKSHKLVLAAAIISLSLSLSGAEVLATTEGAVQHSIAKNQLGERQPVVGDYVVQYEDGYKTISPKAAFEKGYTLVDKDKTSYLGRITSHEYHKSIDDFSVRVSLTLDTGEVIKTTNQNFLPHDQFNISRSSNINGLHISKEDNGYTLSRNKPKAAQLPEKVTAEYLESRIAKEEYTLFEPTLTICVLTMANGFQVTGESACADPATFDAELGKEYARKEAFNKAWMLEGYLLKEKLSNA